MKRWFFDTEFRDNGRSIALISVALVPDDPTLPEYYAESRDFDWDSAGTAWLRQHVQPHLTGAHRLRNFEIATEIVSHLGGAGERIELWGYFPSYDFVALCQLYGPMVSVPAPLPHRPGDLAQLMEWYRIGKSALPAMPTTHNALDDARWNRAVWRTLLGLIPDSRLPPGVRPRADP